MYQIKTINQEHEIDQGEIANIDIYNWDCEYQPDSKALLCYVKDKGFALKMMSDEKNILARFEKPNSPVCRDSCLEFFVNFKPEKNKIGYINFEANPKGTLWAAVGKNRNDRTFLLDMGIKHPEVKPFKEGKIWGYTMFIPLELIQKVYGNSDFSVGDIIKGTFYKCGDDTKNPHYGSYNVIKCKEPDYHCPEFFEDMVIC